MTITAPAPTSTDCAVRVPDSLWPEIQQLAVARGYSVKAHEHADGQIPRYSIIQLAPRGRWQRTTVTIEGLTEREVEVLRGMAAGKTNGDIGRELYLSEDTVKTHARRLFKKLNVPDRASATAAGFRMGVLS